MPITAANIIIKGESVSKTPADAPIRTMDEVRIMAEQRIEKKSRITNEPLIHHRVSAFHADMLHSDKDK